MSNCNRHVNFCIIIPTNYVQIIQYICYHYGLLFVRFYVKRTRLSSSISEPIFN
jgi:hypothetical protein